MAYKRFSQQKILYFSLMKRATTFIPAKQPLILGDLKIDPARFVVERKGAQIRLRKKEFQLLEFLAHNKNQVVSRTSIMEYVWNYDVQAITNTLDVHMSKLRHKIDGEFATKMIQTVYGAGYKLCDHS